MEMSKIFKILVQFLVISGGSSDGPVETEFRIVGGSNCPVTEHPYMVFIVDWDPYGLLYSGGSLITLKWILTAAHCIDQARIDTGLLTVTAGASIMPSISPQMFDEMLNEKDYQVRKAILGVTYSPRLEGRERLFFDIGMIKVNHAFTTSPTVQLARLPDLGLSEICEVATVPGWGSVYKRVPGDRSRLNYSPLGKHLQCADLFLMDVQECQHYWPSATIDHSLLCTATEDGQDACLGDSGGPLVCRGAIIGITSMGKGCGQPGQAAIFTKVEFYQEFIRNTTQLNWMGRRGWRQNSGGKIYALNFFLLFSGVLVCWLK